MTDGTGRYLSLMLAFVIFLVAMSGVYTAYVVNQLEKRVTILEKAR